MHLAQLTDILEALMLVCFGASWPFSILKSLRTKVVKGKSPVFLSLILFGYVFGIAKMATTYLSAKAAAAPGGTVAVPWLAWFYIGLLILVSIDTCLYIKYRKNW